MYKQITELASAIAMQLIKIRIGKVCMVDDYHVLVMTGFYVENADVILSEVSNGNGLG